MSVVTPIDGSTAAAGSTPARIGVLLVNLGTPDTADARGVRVYLKEFLSDARVIEKASADGGLLRAFHVIHGSLMVPGGWGRPIVGWVGVFMFVSCLSGIWLWWPLSGSVASGLKWKRRNTFNANLHYMTGFWILIPLAMLSFTGAWISFPKVFSAFESGPPQRGPDRGAQMRAKPLETPHTPIDAAVLAARPLAKGELTGISWPTDRKTEWTITFTAGSVPAEVKVADADAAATPPEPPKPETLARKMRRWHDGAGMGPVWQVVIFLGGIIPALLSITGIVIWWRARASSTISATVSARTSTRSLFSMATGPSTIWWRSSLRKASPCAIRISSWSLSTRTGNFSRAMSEAFRGRRSG